MTKLQRIERELKIEFPDGFKTVLKNSKDPIHKCVEILSCSSTSSEDSLLKINQRLHSDESDNPLTEFLVAFATHDLEMDDYKVFDTRKKPYQIYTIDTDYPLERQIARAYQGKEYRSGSFEEWYDMIMEIHGVVSEEFEEINASSGQI